MYLIDVVEGVETKIKGKSRWPPSGYEKLQNGDMIRKDDDPRRFSEKIETKESLNLNLAPEIIPRKLFLKVGERMSYKRFCLKYFETHCEPMDLGDKKIFCNAIVSPFIRNIANCKAIAAYRVSINEKEKTAIFDFGYYNNTSLRLILEDIEVV